MSELEKEIKAMCEHREKLCQTIQNDTTALANKFNKLMQYDLELYQKLAGPDCLFMDSPISPKRTQHLLKAYMVKKDMDFISAVAALDGKQAIKDFVAEAREATLWLMRFSKEKPKKKTGLEAITGKEANG